MNIQVRSKGNMKVKRAEKNTFRQKTQRRKVQSREKIRLQQTNRQYEEDKGEGSGQEGTWQDKQEPEQGNLKSHIHMSKSLDSIPTEAKMHWWFSTDHRSCVWESGLSPNLQGLNGQLPGPYPVSVQERALSERGVGITDLGI